MLIRATTQQEAAVAKPKEAFCDRCGVGEEGDLRLLSLSGRIRYAERTVCDGCAEELLEAFVDSLADDEIEERRGARAEAAELGRGR
jgi:superfamily II helicase